MRRVLTLEPDPWIGTLAECRRRTLEAVGDVGPEELDWNPSFMRITIGSLLYHIAAIEADWLYSEIREEEIPGDVLSMFPLDVRDSEGNLVIVTGETMEMHRARLDRVRESLISTVREMDDAEFHRVRSLADCDVSVAWVIQHLVQHESQHRGQILTMRAGR